MRHLALTLTLLACSACGAVAVKPNARAVQFESVEDVFEGPGDLATLSGGLPATFLIASADDADELFATRASLAQEFGETAYVTLLDLSGLDDLQRTELQDRALEAALETDGILLLDLTGASAHSLTGERPGLWLVRVTSDLLVDAELDPSTANADQLRSFPRTHR